MLVDTANSASGTTATSPVVTPTSNASALTPSSARSTCQRRIVPIASLPVYLEWLLLLLAVVDRSRGDVVVGGIEILHFVLEIVRLTL